MIRKLGLRLRLEVYQQSVQMQILLCLICQLLPLCFLCPAWECLLLCQVVLFLCCRAYLPEYPLAYLPAYLLEYPLAYLLDCPLASLLEYFLGHPGLLGSGTMVPLGAHRPTKRFRISVDMGFAGNMYPTGVIHARAMDQHGNWGPLGHIAFNVTPVS